MLHPLINKSGTVFNDVAYSLSRFAAYTTVVFRPLYIPTIVYISEVAVKPDLPCSYLDKDKALSLGEIRVKPWSSSVKSRSPSLSVCLAGGCSEIRYGYSVLMTGAWVVVCCGKACLRIRQRVCAPCISCQH